MTKVLVVDDEEPIVDAISYNLKKEGLIVDTAGDADECISRFLSGSPDLVILDVMLPSGNGLDLCRRLHRHNAALPVLLLTARAAEADCLRGFDAGADDYVVKPFSMRELMARVHSLPAPQRPAGGGGAGTRRKRRPAHRRHGNPGQPARGSAKRRGGRPVPQRV